MKLTIKEVEGNAGKWFVFGQEGMKGMRISEYEMREFVEALETVEPHSVMFFHQNLGVRRAKESGTLVRLGATEETLVKLTHTQMKNLAVTLRSSYPIYF